MIVDKPWGWYETLIEDYNCVIKILYIKQGNRISLQSHKERIENWICISGIGKITIGNKKKDIYKGQCFKININQKHRVKNISETSDLIIVEVQNGICDEYDIIRYEDDYGRIDDGR